eukprot:gb/GECG01014177.1/.p1 GENE.gb/GECG01014177.1/~~gb/GECG01014177.1/.p1  ORF type:complete len:1284 (+),score=143.10 gb/GECG01014177.1/:1-3852(+)
METLDQLKYAVKCIYGLDPDVTPAQQQEMVQKLVAFGQTKEAWSLLPQLLFAHNLDHNGPQDASQAQLIRSTIQMYAANAVYDKVRREWQTLEPSHKDQIHLTLWQALEAICNGAGATSGHSTVHNNYPVPGNGPGEVHVGVVRRIAQALAASSVQSESLHLKQLTNDSVTQLIQTLQHPSSTLEMRYKSMAALREAIVNWKGTSEGTWSDVVSTLMKITEHMASAVPSLWAVTPCQSINGLKIQKRTQNGSIIKNDTDAVFELLRNLGLPVTMVGQDEGQLVTSSLGHAFLVYSCLQVLKGIPEELKSVDIARSRRDEMQNALKLCLPYTYSVITGVTVCPDSISTPANVAAFRKETGDLMLPNIGSKVPLEVYDETVYLHTLTALSTEGLATALGAMSSWATMGEAIGFLKNHYPSLFTSLCASLCLPSSDLLDSVSSTIDVVLQIRGYPLEQGHNDSLACLSMSIGESRNNWHSLLNACSRTSAFPQDQKDVCQRFLHGIANTCNILCENEPEWVATDDSAMTAHPMTTLRECLLQLSSFPLRRVGIVANNAVNSLQMVNDGSYVSNLVPFFKKWFLISLPYLSYPCSFGKPYGWEAVESEVYSTLNFGEMEAPLDEEDFHMYRYETAMVLEDVFAALGTNTFVTLVSHWVFEENNACVHHRGARQHLSWQRLEAAMFVLKSVAEPLLESLKTSVTSSEALSAIQKLARTCLDLRSTLAHVPAPLLRTCCRWIKSFSSFLHLPASQANDQPDLFGKSLDFCLDAMVTPVEDDEDEELADSDSSSGKNTIDEDALHDGSMACLAAANAIRTLCHKSGNNLQFLQSGIMGSMMTKLTKALETSSSLGAPGSVRIKLVEGLVFLVISGYKGEMLGIQETTEQLYKVCQPGVQRLQNLCDQHTNGEVEDAVSEEVDAQLRVIYAVFKFSRVDVATDGEHTGQPHLHGLVETCIPTIVRVLQCLGKGAEISNACLGALEQIISATESLCRPYLKQIFSLLLGHLEQTGHFSVLETMAVAAESFATDSYGEARTDTTTADEFARMTSQLQTIAAQENSVIFQDSDAASSYLTYLQRIAQYFPDIVLKSQQQVELCLDHALRGVLLGSQECSRRSCKLLSTVLSLPDKRWVSQEMISNYQVAIQNTGKGLVDTIVFVLVDEQARATLSTGKSSLPDILFRIISQVGAGAGQWLFSSLKSQLETERQRVFNASGNTSAAGNAMGGLTVEDIDMIVTYLLGAAKVTEPNTEVAQCGRKGGFGRFRMMVHDLSDIARGKNDREALLSYLV